MIRLHLPSAWDSRLHIPDSRTILVDVAADIPPPFLDLAADKLVPGGALHIATDWENYAEHIDEVMETRTDFELDERREHHGDQPLDRHTTKFETRGLRRGHHIWDWRFMRQ